MDDHSLHLHATDGAQTTLRINMQEGYEGEQGLPNATWERWTLNSLVSLPKRLPDDLVRRRF